MIEKSEMCEFAQALVDKHNEDHSEDHEHELKDVLHYQSICEKLTLYCHLNFTTKIKGGCPNESSMDNLVFVEVEHIKKGKFKEQVVNCFCTVGPSDNGCCYYCTRVGNVLMKHPSSSDRYSAGHLDMGLPFGYFANWKRDYEDLDDDEYVKAREAELREMFKAGLHLSGLSIPLILSTVTFHGGKQTQAAVHSRSRSFALGFGVTREQGGTSSSAPHHSTVASMKRKASTDACTQNKRTRTTKAGGSNTMTKTTASAKVDTTPSDSATMHLHFNVPFSKAGPSVSITINSEKAEVRLNAQGPPAPKKLTVRRRAKGPMLSLPAPSDAI